MQDTSVVDKHEFCSLDCEGDVKNVLIVYAYDIDADCYTVETFIDRKSHTVESFDDANGAAIYFNRHVKEIVKKYADEKDEFVKARLEHTVSCLEDVLSENAGELDPDAEHAIRLLAQIIAKGKAAHVRDDLEFSLSTIYADNRI